MDGDSLVMADTDSFDEMAALLTLFMVFTLLGLGPIGHGLAARYNV